MKSSKFKVQSSKPPIPPSSLSSPLRGEGWGEGCSAFRNAHGFTYIALLAAIVIIGISLGAAGKYWQNVVMREKEEELLFRGNQYRLAIERYYKAMPGRAQYPASLEDLLKDNRSAAGKRHLRRKYKDPVTGEDFVELRDLTKGNRIIGVHSASEKKPIRQGSFPEEYREFEGKSKYSEWEFKFVTPLAQPAATGVKPPPSPFGQPLK